MTKENGVHEGTSAESVLTPARVVDRSYLLHEKLGEGGMGVVYRATRRTNGSVVALKLMGCEEGKSPGARVSMRMALAREFETLSSLHHPNVVQVLDYGFDEELGPYFTMELLSSPSTLIAAASDKTPAQRLDLLAQVLRALAYLHRRGVIHCDLKPSNVLVVGDIAKVVDFGLAVRGPHQSQIAGTVHYMAPELFEGEPPSVQSDLFALGVIAQELFFAGEHSDDASVLRLGNAATVTHSPSAAAPIAGIDDVVTVSLRALRGEAENAAPVAAGPSRPRSAETKSFDGTPPPLRPPKHDPALPPPLPGTLQRLRRSRPTDRPSSAAEVLAELEVAFGVALPLETAATRESFLQASTFVGRDEEFALLAAAFSDATRGAGGAWLIGGESGVGKSRLVSELRTRALVEGACVVHGQAVSEGGGSHRVWLPVLRALCLRVSIEDDQAAVLKELIPDLPDLLGRPVPDPPRAPLASAQGRLVDAIEALFRRQPRPTVVILEDLHWANEDSLTLLERLTKAAAERPLLFLCTYRDDQAKELPARLPAMRLLRLERLPRHHVAALCASMLGWAGNSEALVDFLFRETEGNLFFLVEVARALAEQAGQLERVDPETLPEHVLTGGIQSVALRRVDRVPDGGRELVDLAALCGRELDLAVLGRLDPTCNLESWLDGCANAAVFDRQAGDWRFAHDKLREAILARIAPERRAHFHLRIAEAIEAVYEGAARDGRSAALAYHFHHGGDFGRAWSYHERAADVATRLCSYVEARSHHASALEALRRLPVDRESRRREVDTLLKQVYTTMVADSTEQNLARMEHARSLLDAIKESGALDDEDRLRMARVNYVVGRVHFYRGQLREALGYYQKVLPEAQGSGDDELLAMPSCLIGTALAMQGQVQKAESLLHQAIEPLERLGEPFEWFRAVGYHGFALIAQGRYRAGLDELARVHERAGRIGQPSLSSAAHLMRGSSFVMLAADWELGLADMREVLRFAGQTGDKLHLSLAWSNIAWVNSNLGLHDAARECRDKGRQYAQAMGGVMLADWHAAADAEMAFHAGRLDEALERAREVVASSRAAGLVASHGIAERVWGAALALSGDGAEADAHMAESIAVLESTGLVLPAARTRAWWALAKRRRGESVEAEALHAAARAQYAASECDYPLAEVDLRWAGA